MIKAKSPEHAYNRIKYAASKRFPVTITYVRASGGAPTVRTIEPYAFTRNKQGDRYVRAMDRQTGEVRSWRLDRMTGWTIHRTAFQVPARPEPVSLPVTAASVPSPRDMFAVMAAGRDHATPDWKITVQAINQGVTP
jgi:predicted DNA-binding transcriptional regulator YafY